MEASLAENERRLARFDRRLIVPTLLPCLTALALGVLRLLPAPAAKPADRAAAAMPANPRVPIQARSEETSRAL
jgi:hypothetical protein